LSAMQVLVWRLPVTLLLIVPCLSLESFAMPLQSWAWLGTGVLLPGVLASWLFFSALPSVPAGLVSVMTLFEPMVATLVGWCVWGERLPPVSMGGAGLVLIGAARVFTSQGQGRASLPAQGQAETAR